MGIVTQVQESDNEREWRIRNPLQAQLLEHEALDRETYRRSPEIGELAAAMAAAQIELRNPKKTETATVATKSGGQYSYHYMELAQLIEICREVLAKHGLAIFQPVAANLSTVTITTLIAHRSGQWIASDLALHPVDSGPQAIGSAITYARRYGLAAMVGIAGEEDDDGAAASVERDAIRKPAARVTEAAIPRPAATDGRLPEAVQAIWRRMGQRGGIVPEFAALRQQLIAAQGAGAGSAKYQAVLGGFKVTDPGQFRKLGSARLCARALWEELQGPRRREPQPVVAAMDAAEAEVA